MRTILPDEVPGIRDDLCGIDDSHVRSWAATWSSPYGTDRESELDYVLHYLAQAQGFVRTLADDGRGMVYLIG